MRPSGSRTGSVSWPTRGASVLTRLHRVTFSTCPPKLKRPRSPNYAIRPPAESRIFRKSETCLGPRCPEGLSHHLPRDCVRLVSLGLSGSQWEGRPPQTSGSILAHSTILLSGLFSVLDSLGHSIDTATHHLSEGDTRAASPLGCFMATVLLLSVSPETTAPPQQTTTTITTTPHPPRKVWREG